MKRSLILFAVIGFAVTIFQPGCLGQVSSTGSLPPELQELATLAQNNISDDIILSYIRHSGKSYKLTAEDIVTLSKSGVSQNVIAILLQPANVNSAPAVVTTSPVAPVTAVAPSATPVVVESQVTPTYVETQLAPYGEWIYLPEFGTRCWLPAGVSSDWRPYCDAGHWLYTDNGMYWESDYPWGGIAFHYGRWAFRGRWVWVPAYEYAPAWVVWRHSEGYVGWAPIPPGWVPVPPGAVFVGGGWQFNGRSVAVGFDFGLSPTLFIFIGGEYCLDRDFHRHELHGDDWRRVYGRSEVSNLVRDEHGSGFRVKSLERDQVEHWVGRKVEPVRHEEIRVHALDNLHQNAPVEQRSISNFKVNSPASVTPPVQHSHSEPQSAPVTMPRVTTVPATEVQPRYSNQSRTTTHESPVENRDVPAQTHSESSARTSARDEKSTRTESKSATVNYSTSSDNNSRSATSSDSRWKQKDTDLTSPNRN